MKERDPERIVDVQEARGAVLVLHECEALLAKFARRVKIAPHHIKRMQAEQHLEQPWRVPQVLTERAGPGVGVFHLGGGIALDGDQGGAQSGLQAQLVLGALQRVR
jgi:hypothetical protein